MKRSLFFLLAALLSFGVLAGCSDDDDDEPETTEDATDDTVEGDTTEDSTPDTVGDSEGDTTEVVLMDECLESEFEAYATAAGEDCADPGTLASDAALQECGALDCVAGCTEEETQEVVDCIVTEVVTITSINQDCGSCYGQLAACVIGNCAIPCAGGTSTEGCQTCIAENGCNDDLEVCSGLDADYDPCTDGEEAAQPVRVQ